MLQNNIPTKVEDRLYNNSNSNKGCVVLQRSQFSPSSCFNKKFPRLRRYLIFCKRSNKINLNVDGFFQ